MIDAACLQDFTPNYTATSKLFRNGRNTIFFRYRRTTSYQKDTMLESDRSSVIWSNALINCSTNGYIQGRPMLTADQTSTSYEYDHQTSTPTGVICCRIVALTVSWAGIYVEAFFGFSYHCTVTFLNIQLQLMLLLLLHDAFSVFFGDQSAYTVAMVTVRLWVLRHHMQICPTQRGPVNIRPPSNLARTVYENQLLMLRTAGIVIPVYIILVAVTQLLHGRRQRQVCRNPSVAIQKNNSYTVWNRNEAWRCRLFGNKFQNQKEQRERSRCQQQANSTSSASISIFEFQKMRFACGNGRNMNAFVHTS